MRDLILEKAIYLFMNRGFKTVTMDDIASSLGMSKKTIYQHFSNKEHLIDFCLANIIEQIDLIIEAIKQEGYNPIKELFAIRQSIKKMIPAEQESACVFQLSKYYPTTYQDFEANQFKKIKENIKDNIVRGKNEKWYRADLDEDLYARFYFLGIAGVKNGITFKDYPLTLVKDEFLIFFLHGICTNKGITEINHIINE